VDKPSADGSLPTNQPGRRVTTGGSGRVAETRSGPRLLSKIGPSSETVRLSVSDGHAGSGIPWTVPTNA
jgi:hypothetical protein